MSGLIQRPKFDHWLLGSYPSSIKATWYNAGPWRVGQRCHHFGHMRQSCGSFPRSVGLLILLPHQGGWISPPPVEYCWRLPWWILQPYFVCKSGRHQRANIWWALLCRQGHWIDTWPRHRLIDWSGYPHLLVRSPYHLCQCLWGYPVVPAPSGDTKKGTNRLKSFNNRDDTILYYTIPTVPRFDLSTFRKILAKN